MIDLFDLRRDYKLQSLDEKEVMLNPIEMFRKWFDEATASDILEANAMNLATATLDGKPSSRIVLLKQIVYEGFIFFTNYDSKKGQQLSENSYCALNFNWLELERQVRIEGVAEQTSAAESDSYFEVRPPKSKLGAWASPQSQPIPDRDYLDDLMLRMESEYAVKSIPRPLNWGGYIVRPYLIEFWQGRPSRLHDRVEYRLQDNRWIINRLAP